MNNKKEELNNIKKQLSEMEKIHMSIAKEYGSEICAGDMILEEEKLRKQISTLEEQNKNNESSMTKYYESLTNEKRRKFS